MFICDMFKIIEYLNSPSITVKDVLKSWNCHSKSNIKMIKGNIAKSFLVQSKILLDMHQAHVNWFRAFLHSSSSSSPPAS